MRYFLVEYVVAELDDIKHRGTVLVNPLVDIYDRLIVFDDAEVANEYGMDQVHVGHAVCEIPEHDAHKIIMIEATEHHPEWFNNPS